MESRLPPTGIEERFELIREIGEGATSRVWLARQKSLGREVALKILASPGSDLTGRFLAEARLLASLQHPSIVKLYDFGQVGPVLYLATEFIAAGSLSLRLALGPLPWGTAARLTARLASGLEAVHAAGILHRDLKPDNILLEREEYPRLIDFGFARVSRGPSMTESGIIIATPAYASPEQLEGRELGPASDLYSLGVVLHHMVTGVNPFDGGSFPETLHRQLNLRPEALPRFPAGVPPALEKLARRLLRKGVEDRPASAAEVMRALEPLLERMDDSVVLPAPLLADPGATASLVIPPPPQRTAVIEVTSPPSTPARDPGRLRAPLGFLAGILAAAGLVTLGRQVALSTRPPPPSVATSPLSARVPIDLPAAPPSLEMKWKEHHLVAKPHKPLAAGTGLELRAGTPSALVTSVTTPPYVFDEVPAGLAGTLAGRLEEAAAPFEDPFTAPAGVTVHDLRSIPSDLGVRVTFESRGPARLELRVTGADGAVHRRPVDPAGTPSHVHHMIVGLTADHPYRLDVVPDTGWGGLRGVTFRTLPSRPPELTRLIEQVASGAAPDAAGTEALLTTQDPAVLPGLRGLASRPGRQERLTEISARLAWFQDREGARLLIGALERDPTAWSALDPVSKARVLAGLGHCREATVLARGAGVLLESVEAVKILPLDERILLLDGLARLALATPGEDGEVTLRRTLEATAPRVDVLLPLLAADGERAGRILREWAGGVDTANPSRQLALLGLGMLGRSRDLEHLDLHARSRANSRLRPQAMLGLHFHASPPAVALLRQLSLERTSHLDRLWPALLQHPEDLGDVITDGLTHAMLVATRREDTPALVRRRHDLVLALGALRHEAARDALELVLDDPSPVVVRAAIWSLARLCHPGLADALARHLASPDTAEDVALWAAGEVRAGALAPRLIELAGAWESSGRPRDQMRFALACWSLGRLGAAREAIEGWMTSASRPPWMARVALWGRDGAPPGSQVHFYFPFLPFYPTGIRLWPEETVEISVSGLWGEVESPTSRVPASRTLEAWAGSRPIFRGGRVLNETGIRMERRELVLSAAPLSTDVRMVPHHLLEGVAVVLLRPMER